MIVRVQCPNPDCRKRYKIEDSLLGQTSACKECGRVFVLSAPAGQTIEAHGQTETRDGVAALSQETPGGVPDQLGRFQIRSRLGAGAFGTVYRAFDPVLGREVALKVPRSATLEKPEARARFLREPKAAAQLRHPNIVPIYDAGTDGEHYYIASAFIEGQTLAEALEHDRPDFRRAATIVRHLAEALDYAHRNGVVHRDVKPANVVLDGQGEPSLMDFGLAKLESTEEKLTQDGTVMGTPAYMAPEQADGTLGEVGPASDQYSLGVVLYELLCGQTPFSGLPVVLLYNVMNQEPPPPSGILAGIPRDLETICLKAMAKRPADRYGSCGALAEDLRRWLEDEPIHVRRISPPERFARWCRKNPALATSSSVAIVLLIITAAVAIVAYLHSSRALTTADAQRDRAEQALSAEALQRGRAEEALKHEATARQEAETHRQRAEAALAAADGERQKAEEERQRAEAERARAENALKNEAAARMQAEAEGQRAEQAAQKEVNERLRAEKNLYVSFIMLAQLQLAAGNLDAAGLHLEACPEELRHWEWGYLKRRTEKTGQIEIAAHEHAVFQVCFESAGVEIASCDKKNVKVWNAGSGLESRSADVPDYDKGAYDTHQCVWLGDDGQRVASFAYLTDSKHFHVWDVYDGKTPLVFDTQRSSVSELALDHNGNQIASRFGSSVWFWDVASANRLFAVTAPTSNSGYPWGMTFSRDGSLFAVTTREGLVIWDLSEGRRQRTVTIPFAPTQLCLAFNFDGSRIAIAKMGIPYDHYRKMHPPEDTNIEVFDTASGQKQLTLGSHKRPVNALAFSPDDKRIASGSDDDTCKLWDAETGLELITLRATADVLALAFSPDGSKLACGEGNGSIHIWDAGVEAGPDVDQPTTAD